MKKTSMPLKARLAKYIEFPPDTFGGISTIYMTSNNQLTITECGGIVLYSDSEIRLNLKNLQLQINGDKMTLQVFKNNIIEISGIINEIKFI